MKWQFAKTMVGWISLTGLPLYAQTAPPVVDYKAQIKPLLQAHCFACHGTLKQESNLRLDSGNHMLKGGEIGPALVAGNSKESLLYQVLTDDADFEMPPKGQGRKLKPDEVNLIKRWIEQGAKFPDNDRPEADPADHWAFQQIKRPSIPTVQTKVINPIDAFVAYQQEHAGLIPQPETDKATLLRRVYLDLIGLPPTPEELHAFLNDSSPNAFQRVVEDLLKRPQYGERWGRHWMDVWRYSDWYGRRGAKDMTNSYSLTWRWRDWIIRSLNEDKGYDRMVMEMLAADEIAPNDLENLVATGFIVRNFYRWNYHTWLKDNVEHTSKAFLGLTMNCCECHDHKYDPIGQEEYFSFRSFFEPIDLRHDRVPGEADPGEFPEYKLGVRNGPVRTGMVRIYDKKLDAKAKFYTGGLEQNLVKDKPPAEAAAIKFLKGDQLQFGKVDLPVTAWYPGLKPFVIKEETQKRESDYQAALKAWEQQKSHLEQSLKKQEALLAKTILNLTVKQKAEISQANSKQPRLINRQALRLKATQGRRTLSHEMSGWKSFDTETLVRFQLKILSDSLVNFQLSNDLSAGRTNLYVAFHAGKIITFAPGTTSKAEIGSYKTDSGKLHFQINILLQPEKDIAELTITQIADSKVIVDHKPIALNGWNPIGAKNRGIFLDAHPGSVAEFDDIVFMQNGSEEIQRFDFEFPNYRQGEDIPGIENWQATRFSSAPATSQVVLHKPLTEAEQKLQQEIKAATEKRDLAKLKRDVIQFKMKAARDAKQEYAARVQAAKARYIDQTKNFESLEQAASQAERQANLSRSESKLKSAKLALLEAKQLPSEDKARAKKIQAAEKQLSQSQGELKTAQKAVKETTTTYSKLSPQYPKQSTGKRTALAQWIVDRNNPLTARVAVNHIWMRHFGQPIVKSVYNFGRSGAKPTHPALLDWLAVELMDHQWSMKHLHRQIVLSKTYQRSSRGVDPQHVNHSKDRDNQLLWKFPTNRMEAEVIRDSLFYLAKDLDPKMFGQELEQDQGLITNRRSIYYSHHGEAKMEFLELFDAASATDCYERKSSIMPQQALALTNSQLSVQKGRQIANQLWSQVVGLNKTREQKNQAFIQSAFELILTRPASDKEQIAATKFLSGQERLFSQAKTKPAPQTKKQIKNDFNQPATEPEVRARESFVQALFSHNDFVTIR
ncbi:PSD1 and planctomycete cytochrome C domain-containing protein [Gimesia aquarii]|uniref:Planctomycete cytochrome C n=1 Tax=Gimesia aquarii TaxID=2527964 RepID=A0A517X0B1_9PLAN|nr:PSD1 and planctomycete cytochrome C domain-containing protein [Gimesia aquarii]QDU10948.1 Planctomycete cytochrome C [Gimesia aquarii]